MPGRTLAIGDIHGCLLQLDALLEAVELQQDDHLIPLGDYIDRGPHSAGVLNRIIQLSKSHHVSPIKGNHEQMMMLARKNVDRLRDWVMNGGDATLLSYAGRRATLRDVPREHWNFLEHNLLDFVETETHIFVHANAAKNLPMPDQPDYMLRWERCDEIAPHQSGKTIVCGHTPQRYGRPMNRGYAICIDTYAFGGQPLTCLDATSGKIWQADNRGRITHAHIADFQEH